MMSGGHQGSEYNLWKVEQDQVAFRRKDLVANPLCEGDAVAIVALK